MRYLLLLALITGCTTLPVESPKPEEKPAEVVEAPPVDASKFIAYWDGKKRLKKGSTKVLESFDSDLYTRLLVDAIEKHGADLLAAKPVDMKEYCPNYESLDRDGKIQMWVMLFSRLAAFEAGYRPWLTYFEKTVQDNPTSRGLFQISIASANGNYKCGIKKAEDLHDEKTNIDCLIKAANILVPAGDKSNSPVKSPNEKSYVGGRYENAWKALAKYWSPFRRPHQIVELKKAARSVCK